MDTTNIYNFNKYQTQLTDELLNELHPEVREKLFECINTVPFIANLISKDRPYAKDLPRDDSGKIIIDLCNPHILENMDYFREMAIHFEEHGCYTKLRPNTNPNSEFGQLIKREIMRILNGMVRPEDGEWVTGEFYFYLNYSRMSLTKTKKGQKMADRVESFPETWEGVYLLSHYLHQARFGGLYDNFEGGKQAAEIAKRGASKSYFMSATLARLFCVGDTLEARSKVTGVITAYEKEYLTKDGTLNKFISTVDFLADNCPFFPSAKIKDSLQEMDWIMGYKDADTGVSKGLRNEILGFSSKDNPDKGRGKRAAKIIFEEFGNFPKFLDTWNTSLPSVKEGEFSFGQMIAIGTGGTEGSDFSGAQELIYHPDGYDVYGLKNVFDSNMPQGSKSCFFFGAYLSHKGYYNCDGVSDVIGSLIFILKERIKVKYNSSDPNTLSKKISELPITIKEAILKRDGTIYPVNDLSEQLTKLDADPTSLSRLYVGDLSLTGVDVKFNPTSDVTPIMDFPHKTNKYEGAVIIHELPIKGVDGKPQRGRYIAGQDTYDDDSSDSLSLGALYIMDLWTDKLVLEYVGRPTFADDFYENCRRCLLFYNAECNYENNKKGLFKYFSQHNSLYLLSPTLDFLKEKQMMKENSYGNKAYGTLSTTPIKNYGRRCIRDWLLKPVQTTVVKPDEDGVLKEEEITVRNLTFIPFRALLQELIGWNMDGNFDRHDALLMLMLLREDKLRLFGDNAHRQRENTNSTDDLSNDSFFEKNYNGR